MSGFKGSHRSLLDSKGRVAVPVKLRRNTAAGAADRFVITRGLDGCLFLFPPDYWDQVVSRLETMSFTQDDAKFFTRMLTAYADDVELDAQSRIRIPQILIEKAKLEKEVLFVGALKRIEIWRPSAFEEYENNYPSTYEEVAAKLFI